MGTDRRRLSLRGKKTFQGRSQLAPSLEPEAEGVTKPRGRKADGLGFDPAHPSPDFTRLDNQRGRGRKVDGFGFDPAQPSDNFARLDNQRARGRKVSGFGFDPAHPTPSPAVANALIRCRKASGFGFDPASPTPNPQDRGLKVAEFGHDPSNPTQCLQAKHRAKRTSFPKWEPQSFHEVKQNGMRHKGIKVIAPPGGATTFVLD